MRALFDRAALVHHHDAVRVAHGGEPVGDDQCGASGAQAGERRGVERDSRAVARRFLRAAVERRDIDGLQHALARIDGWLQRLLAGSPGLPQKRRLLAELKALPLRMESPLAGTTLQQLRALRGK